ncbi:MAG TPA: Gfo/Idh/MocA family oxidoreductase [Bacteroidia bacterium]|jgi:predicted dehydrogenase
MKIGIIGFGYWGPNLLRNFYSIDACKVEMVSDLRQERLKIIKKNYPTVKTTTDAADIIQSTSIDAVVIATPVFSHFNLAKQALLKGKHVLIEKPMTASSAEASELIELAASLGKVIMVDHTFLYTGAVQKMKTLVESGSIGKINYFDSTRINLGLFQPDVNVLWDLAPHDISILNYLVKEKPVSVNATGISHTKNEIENIAYMTVNYQSDFVAHFNCSWSSPVKIRMTLVGGTEKMIVFNDMEPTEKIKVYDSGYSMKTDEEKQRILVDYRAGDIFTPKVQMTEALSLMAVDFVNAISKGTDPVSDFNIGLDVVKILEAAQKSIKQKGKEILL